MNTVLQQWGVCAFVALWIGGGVILLVRSNGCQVAYLKRFPPVNGVPLYMTWHGNPFGTEARALYRATWKRQPDPELERMRREARRSYWHVLYWVFGFPALIVGIVALLMLTIFPQ